jgi:hypothetical protein
MATFYWLPFKSDNVWAPYFGFARTGALGNMKHLPYMPVNGRWDHDSEQYPLDDRKGSWSQVVTGDTVKIVTHGRKYSTTSVAWVCNGVPGGLISWTAAEMAAVLKRLTSHVAGPIDWDLLACFGADDWGLSKSFASRLLAEMRRLGMRGSLTAYNGATNIGAGQGRQTGTGRFSTGLYMLSHGGRTDRNGIISTEASQTWPL